MDIFSKFYRYTLSILRENYNRESSSYIAKAIPASIDHHDASFGVLHSTIKVLFVSIIKRTMNGVAATSTILDSVPDYVDDAIFFY